MAGEMADPLSIHTSSGVPAALSEFIDALTPFLPWKNQEELDWCVSLQIEGASAVWAAIDMLLQELILTTGEKNRKKVAVGANSYHGPPSTSFGAKSPLWRKNHQLKYPVPTPFGTKTNDELIAEYETFLNEHGSEIGVIVFEPQWGSSQAALPWPRDLLTSYIKMAKAHGIRVLCDEIMCGLGRHGHGTLFVSEAWELDPDAVTFGKAIGGGVYPMSGAILKKGRDILQANKCSVMQSHTYAASSTRALMTATAVLKEMVNWFPIIAKNGEEMAHIFSYLTKVSGGMITAQGQGLMWGVMFSHEGQNMDDQYRLKAFATFKKVCEEGGILPYFVPVGGFMVTPMVDVDVGTIYEIGLKLEEAIRKTMKEMDWEAPSSEGETSKADASAVSPIPPSKCSTNLHATRSCTSCTDFVCQNVRSRFLSRSRRKLSIIIYDTYVACVAESMLGSNEITRPHTIMNELLVIDLLTCSTLCTELQNDLLCSHYRATEEVEASDSHCSTP